jgi:membrane-associated phospholipid phosphatase
MALFTVRPTNIDKRVAREVISHTDRRIERFAGALTWGADEHVLLVLATAGWLLTRQMGERERRIGTHFFACSGFTALLPHLMKRLINQERPDRLTIEGHLFGVPLSGNAEDAFPSGHALHVGGLASAATLLPPKYRNAIWATGALLVTTRVVLLAHWFTDVLAGLAFGVCLERGLRFLTKPPEITTGTAREAAPHRTTRPLLMEGCSPVGSRGD